MSLRGSKSSKKNSRTKDEVIPEGKTPQEWGYWFEDKCREAFKEMRRFRRSTFLRLYDTKSAASYIPEQPGDFILITDGHCNLIEAKSSVNHKSMSESRKALALLKDSQAPHLKIWARARATTLIVFLSVEDKEVEFWDGAYVADCRLTPRMNLDVAERIARVPLNQLKETLEANVRWEK